MAKLCFLVSCVFTLALGGGVVVAGVCQSPAYGGEGDWLSTDFELRAPAGQRIEAIHLCAMGYKRFSDFVGGFQVLYSNGFLTETVGCEDRIDIFDPIILGEDEDVTSVDIYHGTNNFWELHVVQALTFHTTEGVYGPYGFTDQAQKETVQGNNLIGFNGTQGFILDNLSVIFESC